MPRRPLGLHMGEPGIAELDPVSGSPRGRARCQLGPSLPESPLGQEPQPRGGASEDRALGGCMKPPLRQLAPGCQSTKTTRTGEPWCLRLSLEVTACPLG